MNHTLAILAACARGLDAQRLDHVTTSASTTVLDAKGVQQRIPATQHRFVADALTQVDLPGKTRMVRTIGEAREQASPCRRSAT